MSTAAASLPEEGPGAGEESPDWAYERCRVITKREAANFYYGIRLLSQEKRMAMCAAYAFARRVDDIGDGDLPAPEKLARLEAVTRDLRSMGARGEAPAAAAAGVAGAAGLGLGGRHPGSVSGPAPDPVMTALADARTRFPLPQGALLELVEGVRMDVLGTSYETFDDLLPYCQRVAGGIGRLCLGIFGARDPARAAVMADELGVAMQLTNITRDIREDAENGRVYLPAEDLRRFGLGRCADPAQLAALARVSADAVPQVLRDPAPGGEVAQLLALIRFQAQRAEQWFERGLALRGQLDRRSAACVLAMSGIYRTLLRRIQERPQESLRRRMSLRSAEKLLVALRCALGARV